MTWGVCTFNLGSLAKSWTSKGNLGWLNKFDPEPRKTGTWTFDLYGDYHRDFCMGVVFFHICTGIYIRHEYDIPLHTVWHICIYVICMYICTSSFRDYHGIIIRDYTSSDEILFRCWIGTILPQLNGTPFRDSPGLHMGPRNQLPWGVSKTRPRKQYLFASKDSRFFFVVGRNFPEFPPNLFDGNGKMDPDWVDVFSIEHGGVFTAIYVRNYQRVIPSILRENGRRNEKDSGFIEAMQVGGVEFSRFMHSFSKRTMGCKLHHLNIYIYTDTLIYMCIISLWWGFQSLSFFSRG